MALLQNGCLLNTFFQINKKLSIFNYDLKALFFNEFEVSTQNLTLQIFCFLRWRITPATNPYIACTLRVLRVLPTLIAYITYSLPTTLYPHFAASYLQCSDCNKIV